jgi:hypothetical protein
MIERLIVVGLINSTEYIQQIRGLWDPGLLESQEAYYIAQWAVAYFDKYGNAPGRLIEDIYYDKKQSGEIPEDHIPGIKDSLEDLALEYDEGFNLQYALDQTQKYFKRRSIEEYERKLNEFIEDRDFDGAEEFTANYRIKSFHFVNDLDLSKPESMVRIESAFAHSAEPLIKYPGALGSFVNDHLIRGGFVALMGPEKRGKSFLLLDMAIRASYRRNKVAFFQAGDMTEQEQILRIGSYLTKLPILERNTGEMFIPVADCLRNQLDICDLKERRCDFGIFTSGDYDETTIRKELTKERLEEAFEDYGDDYRPCTVCDEYKTRHLGVPWLKQITLKRAVTFEDSKKKYENFFQKKHRVFKISTHINDALTVTMIRGTLDRWEREDGFVPDVIAVDYADLLVPEKNKEFRHGQNEIWKNLRALSQERNCLVLTATQADAKSYESDLLKMSNYSEDKRKFAHVTAMFGLNQDKKFREKRLGLMRINHLVIRAGNFDSVGTVTILQDLNTGQPFLDSYF